MKQVIVVNEALHLPRGKLAAQVAHASVAALFDAEDDTINEWLATGMAKIVLRVDDENKLMSLYNVAKGKKIAAQLIKDAGRTVVAAGTMTCLGLGPADDDLLDSVTGDLSLL